MVGSMKREFQFRVEFSLEFANIDAIKVGMLV